MLFKAQLPKTHSNKLKAGHWVGMPGCQLHCMAIKRQRKTSSSVSSVICAFFFLSFVKFTNLKGCNIEFMITNQILKLFIMVIKARYACFSLVSTYLLNLSEEEMPLTMCQLTK